MTTHVPVPLDILMTTVKPHQTFVQQETNAMGMFASTVWMKEKERVDVIHDSIHQVCSNNIKNV